MEEKRNAYVVGHRNPDTDSICSAIAYAQLKNFEGGSEYNFLATRAGQINAETEYVLQRFGTEPPVYLNNLGTRVKEMEIRHAPSIRSNLSLRKAWQLMINENCVTLPIVDDENKLEGLITIQDIAKAYMEEMSSSILSDSKTPYRNIVETLDAELIVGDIDGCFDKGKVLIAAANPDVMENYIEPGDMVILGNRYESQLSAIEMDAGCIIVCLDSPVSKSIKHLAQNNGCTVIVTPLDTFACARLLNQSMMVEYFMTRDNLITFDPYDFTDAVKEEMTKRRFRDFPVLDKGRYIGMISRRNLLSVKKRAVILVDHNEESQAVDNIKNADILEVIDHHRLGSLETIEPVYFRNEPVGCTATIIYEIYNEKGIEIPKNIAGLLCSAIISDTLIFRSPTCTVLDKAACKELAQIAGIDDIEAFAIEMFTAGSNLGKKTAEEIFFQDYKKFEFGKTSFAVGQINSMNAAELELIKEKIIPVAEKARGDYKLDMVFFMLTDILKERSELICFGKEVDDFISDAFGRRTENGSIILEGVISRKKQLIPAFMNAISKDALA